ncbi:MAG: CinA family protein [Gemmatimonadota bacterium]
MDELAALAAAVAGTLRSRSLRLATAESCTGGWVAKVCTDLSGSSAWFEGGFVTYSNAAKEGLLGVDAATLAEHGAVSEATVRQMAEGARLRIEADVTVAISGIAGPGGAVPGKPVGTVWFAWATPDGTSARRERFDGDRDQVRRAAVAAALQGVLDVLAG